MLHSRGILDAIFARSLVRILYTLYCGYRRMAGLDPTFPRWVDHDLVGVVGLVLTQGRDKDNIFAKFFSDCLAYTM